MYCGRREGARLKVRPSKRPRGVERLDGLPGQPAVARHVVRHQRLDARVARVLQLLVVRAVHVRFVRAQARGPPADVEHARDLVARRLAAGSSEGRRALERVARVDGTKVVHGQRRVLRLDRQLEVAEGPPPERPEHAPRPAVRHELVAVAAEDLARDLVPMSLGGAGGAGEQGLRVPQPDRGAGAARHLQLGVRRRELVAIEQHADLAPRPDRPVGRSGRHGRRHADAVGLAHTRQALGPFFHQRDGARHQHEAAVRVP